jgi:assimilatory nitrate reductase catalytic subunit
MFKEWRSPEAAFQILKRLTKGRPCDFSGIEDYKQLDAQGGIQWPLPEGAGERAQERRLFEDGKFYTPDGRARFVFEAPRPMAEPTDSAYPLLLLTGRGSASQWHTQTRTAKSAVLRTLYPQDVYVEINPEDAARLKLKTGQRVRIVSRRGELVANPVVNRSVKPGQVFIPMHYDGVNRLTYPSFDPYSKQPSYKACAVKLEAVDE